MIAKIPLPLARQLWGDVPALMPPIAKGRKLPGFRFDGSGRSFQSASVEGVKNGGGSTSRKFASAMIAKIPLPLARHIGRVFRPAAFEAAA